VKVSKYAGSGSLFSLLLAGLFPLVSNRVMPAYVFFGVALVLSIVAGATGSRRWFILTGLLALVLLVFAVFLAVVLEGSRVGG
jgi:hypothetical protein